MYISQAESIQRSGLRYTTREGLKWNIIRHKMKWCSYKHQTDNLHSCSGIIFECDSTSE